GMLLLVGTGFVERAAAAGAQKCSPSNFYYCTPVLPEGGRAPQAVNSFCTSKNMGGTLEGICCPLGLEPTIIGFRPDPAFSGQQPIWDCSPFPKPPKCPKGLKLMGGHCVPDDPTHPSCPDGKERVGNRCVNECKTGYHRDGIRCVRE